jgi:hypothetical protein
MPLYFLAGQLIVSDNHIEREALICYWVSLLHKTLE